MKRHYDASRSARQGPSGATDRETQTRVVWLTQSVRRCFDCGDWNVRLDPGNGLGYVADWCSQNEPRHRGGVRGPGGGGTGGPIPLFGDSDRKRAILEMLETRGARI